MSVQYKVYLTMSCFVADLLIVSGLNCVHIGYMPAICFIGIL